MRGPWICNCFALFLILNCYSTTAQPPFGYPTANLDTIWTNDESLPHSVDFIDGSRVRPILLRGSLGPKFACGFYCNGTCTSYLFAVFIVQTNKAGGIVLPAIGFPQVVWSANRDRPVNYGAIVNLTSTGELVLQDADGSTVWTTNNTGKFVAGLNLTDDGNLVMFDINSSVVWQSFDYPTDCLLPGQKLFQGQQLIPSVSSTNWTALQGLYSLQVTDNGLFAYIGSNPPQAYRGYRVPGNDTNTGRRYITFSNGSLSFFVLSIEPSDPYELIPIPKASSAQYIKLMPDGHLKMFEWQSGWLVVDDLLNTYLGECDYPLACGKNGLCWSDDSKQECGCPSSSNPTADYFKERNDGQLGCNEPINPLSCSMEDQDLFEFENITYFNIIADMEKVDIETCKQACANNCSCKAALFQYGSNFSVGSCYLPSELFTMTNTHPDRNTSFFIKMHINAGPNKSVSLSTLGVILVSTIGSVPFLLGVIRFLVYIIHKRRKATKMDEETIGEVPGMPTRFLYEELKEATESFSIKLGEGGFGAVFQGTLEDDSKIAVKRLEGLGLVNKSFLAEVVSIGSIHHVNLVRLRGFCAWKSQRFLVYEFMSNGSLDRWIYHGDREHVLEWQCRKKIILDVTKGLAYLHEDCRQKIIHLDIKPQNILLDSDFNAKVSDFGLSKLIDRHQTHVMTTMRGTPGYLAPEWLSSVITEKVDVYSFGIVLLEMLCARKKFDRSQPEERWHLLGVLQRCWEQGMLLDMVDKYSEDMKTHGSEVVKMIKAASWCLQYDYTKRPSMSTVVNVLEGVVQVESRLDYNFTGPRQEYSEVEDDKDMTPLTASALSGPR